MRPLIIFFLLVFSVDDVEVISLILLLNLDEEAFLADDFVALPDELLFDAGAAEPDPEDEVELLAGVETEVLSGIGPGIVPVIHILPHIPAVVNIGTSAS